MDTQVYLEVLVGFRCRSDRWYSVVTGALTLSAAPGTNSSLAQPASQLLTYTFILNCSGGPHRRRRHRRKINMDPLIEKDTESHVLDGTLPNANTPILRLTPALRRRIYLDAYLNVSVRHYSWTLGEEHAVLNLNGGNTEPTWYHYERAHKLGIYGLLVCCRTIYAEVSDLLYSSNRFVIRYWEKQSLSPLRALTPSSLSSLTHLKIVLNQASCHCRDFTRAEDHQGQCCVARNLSHPEYHERLHDAPLDLNEAKSKALLDEWKSAAEHISRHISTQRLELCVVCDMCPDDLEGAAKMLEPLRFFSDLRNCHIRLSRDPSPQLQRMAHDMVLKSRGLLLPDEPDGTSQTEPRGVSRLLALPRELRLHILSYTDLITPWKQVEWSRECNDDGKYLIFHTACEFPDKWRCDPRRHQGCQFSECWPAHSRLSKVGIGCFCQVRHSASSSTCMCWAPPTALFLVSLFFFCLSSRLRIEASFPTPRPRRAEHRHHRSTALCFMMRRSSSSLETVLLYMTTGPAFLGAYLALPHSRARAVEKTRVGPRELQCQSITQIGLPRASSYERRSRIKCSESYVSSNSSSRHTCPQTGPEKATEQ